MVNIAVMGYGTVGSGVVEVINGPTATSSTSAQATRSTSNTCSILRDFPGRPDPGEDRP